MSTSDRERRPGLPQDRDQRLRRTTSTRRGIVTAGTLGALGAAVAIGVHQAPKSAPTASDSEGSVTRHSPSQRATQPTSDFGDDSEGSDDGGQPAPPKQQPSQGGGQLATPGNGGPAQGSSGGS